mmetsp:Transcript_57648/g.160658  ORF Transcript_57648/g.160658 Transcript_57648/m.160658 type:complete len:376 (-) Transcript_57648:97-1224(-)
MADEPPALERLPTAQILEVFNRFDEDGDGTIDVADLERVLQKLNSETWDESRLQQLREQMDVDKDGRVSYMDFVHWSFCAGSEQEAVMLALKGEAKDASSSGEARHWMLHDRGTDEVPRTSLRVHPSDVKEYLPHSAYNGEVVEILGYEGQYANARLALSGCTGWLHRRHLHQCPEGTAHDRAALSGGVRRVELRSHEGRLKEVRRFLRRRNFTRDAGEIRAETVWFLRGQFLGEVGMKTGTKATLFFGCRDSWVVPIARSGFDAIFPFEAACGDFGKGAHFSPQSCKAFTRCESYMFICEVALGNEDERMDLSNPYPTLDPEIVEEAGKLSVQCLRQSGSKFDEHVVYKPGQCKPVYLIKLEYPGMHAYGRRLG